MLKYTGAATQLSARSRSYRSESGVATNDRARRDPPITKVSTIKARNRESTRSVAHGCSRQIEEPFVIIDVPDGPIAMSSMDFRASRELARLLLGQPAISQSEAGRRRIVDANELASLLSVKASWLLQRARESRIPHVRVGKYVRFDVDEVWGWLKEQVASGD